MISINSDILIILSIFVIVVIHQNRIQAYNKLQQKLQIIIKILMIMIHFHRPRIQQQVTHHNQRLFKLTIKHCLHIVLLVSNIKLMIIMQMEVELLKSALLNFRYESESSLFFILYVVKIVFMTKVLHIAVVGMHVSLN